MKRRDFRGHAFPVLLSYEHRPNTRGSMFSNKTTLFLIGQFHIAGLHPPQPAQNPTKDQAQYCGQHKANQRKAKPIHGQNGRARTGGNVI